MCTLEPTIHKLGEQGGRGLGERAGSEQREGGRERLRGRGREKEREREGEREGEGERGTKRGREREGGRGREREREGEGIGEGMGVGMVKGMGRVDLLIGSTLEWFQIGSHWQVCIETADYLCMASVSSYCAGWSLH